MFSSSFYAIKNMKITFEQLQEEYEQLLDGPVQKEEVYHQFFVKYPIFLPLWKPYNNVIFSKLNLSTQHQVDFAFARENTPGMTWHFIEIEKRIINNLRRTETLQRNYPMD